MTEENVRRFNLKIKVKKALHEYEESQIYKIKFKQKVEILSELYFDLLNELLRSEQE